MAAKGTWQRARVLLSATAASFILLSGLACGPSDSAGAALQENVTASAGSIAKVTYRAVVIAEGQTTEGVVVVAQRPPDRRIDFIKDGMIENSYGVYGGNTVECTVSGCGSVDTDDDSAILALFHLMFGPAGRLLEEETEGYDISTLPDRTIIGLDGDCFRIAPQHTPAAFEPIATELCFSPTESFLLSYEIRYDSGLAFSMDAEAVNTSVMDSDLRPPY